MSSFLTSANIASITGAYQRLWETTAYHSLIIHKEPQKVVTLPQARVYAGYGSSSEPDNVSYIPVTGIYAAAVTNNKTSQQTNLSELHTSLTIDSIRIKVEEDCKNFINNGGNERFELNGSSYNSASIESVENFFGLKFYNFILERTQ
jgi:hypothetical protein